VSNRSNGGRSGIVTIPLFAVGTGQVALMPDALKPMI
jgi:hypothetical protein